MAVPWALEVQRFAEARTPELKSLFAALRASGKKEESEGGEALASIVEIPARDRRRTRSHKRRKPLFWTRKNGGKSSERKKTKKDEKEKAPEAVQGQSKNAGPELEQQVPEAENAKEKSRKRELKVSSLSRRVRRRIEFQAVGQGKGGCCKDGTQRLATHVWHAKRFEMSKMWGYWLPGGIPGRGRGSKAVLRWASQGVVLHDCSYYSAVQLEGSQEEISKILSLLLEPLFAPASTDSRSKLGCHFSAMVHRCGKVPFSPIAPATVVFCPTRNKVQEKMWIWVHGAAFEEVLKTLQSACEVYPNVTCRSRKGELARLELSGKKSFELLQKTLKSRVPTVVSLQHFLSEKAKNAYLPLEVYDPREISLLKDYSEIILCEDDTPGVNIIVEDSNAQSDCLWRRLMDQRPTYEHNSSLWGPIDAVKPPCSEKAINRKQQKHRLSQFHPNDKEVDASSWTGCSIFLLKHSYKSSWGCSIILPVTWVHAFWMPLVLAGARVLGQNERRWLMTHAGLTSFPYDYPDCLSYKDHVHSQRQEMVEINERKPPQKRLPSVPFPRWIETGSEPSGSGIETVSDGDKRFSGFIARSHFLLSSYLRLHSLNSFPGVHHSGSDEQSWAMLASQSSCFCRIMILPAGKGVIDEGSALYAPESDDFEAWQGDRSEDNWRGTDVKTGQRRVIGFVTTAAPHHSRDAAVGFCDVREISELRSRQKREADAKFFLLFHNNGSSMLRPALASAVLELE